MSIAVIALLVSILIVLIESRITVGTKVAVIERDLEWISASLVKWGMIAPLKTQEVDKRDKDGQ